MDGFHTRPAVHDDVDDLLRFWARAGENGSRPADRPDLVRQLIDRDPEALTVATHGGRIVATIIAGWDGWRANLYRLAVDPEFRGRGLGRHMLELGERRLVELGAQRTCAMVLDDNRAAQGLWRSSGYSPQAEWSRWVKQAPSEQ